MAYSGHSKFFRSGMTGPVTGTVHWPNFRKRKARKFSQKYVQKMRNPFPCAVAAAVLPPRQSMLMAPNSMYMGYVPAVSLQDTSRSYFSCHQVFGPSISFWTPRLLVFQGAGMPSAPPLLCPVFASVPGGPPVLTQTTLTARYYVVKIGSILHLYGSSACPPCKRTYFRPSSLFTRRRIFVHCLHFCGGCKRRINDTHRTDLHPAPSLPASS